MIEVNQLKIKKSNVRALKERYKWAGTGTSEDPIEITTTEDLPGLLYFKTGDVHVRLKGIRHHSVKLKNCRNIEIDSSRICHIELIECWNISVKDNYIGSIKLEYCKGNAFEGNKIGELKSVIEHNPKEKLGLDLGLMMGFGSFFWILTAYLVVVVSINVLKRFNTIDISTWIGLIVFMGFLLFMSIILLWGTISCVKTMLRLKMQEINKIIGNSIPSIDEYRAELCRHCAFERFCEESQFLKYMLGGKVEGVPQISAEALSTIQSKSIVRASEDGIVRESPQEAMVGRDSYSLRYPKGSFVDLGLIGCALCLAVPLLIIFSVAFYGSELGFTFLAVLIFCLVGYSSLIILAYKKAREYKKEKKLLEPHQPLNESSTAVETSRCRSCGRSVSLSAKYCRHCGSQLQ